MKKSIAAVLLVLSPLILAGCNRVSSCDLLTAGLYLDMLVTEENGQATVYVALWAGDGPRGTNVELGPCGDAITVNGVNLREVRGVWTYYEAVFTPAATYEFVLTRPDKVIHSSTVTPPPTVTIQAPSQGDQVSRQNPVAVQWDANGNPSQTLRLDRDVFFAPHDSEASFAILDVPDDGDHALDLAALEDAGNANDPWTVEVTLTRTVNGQLDPGLTGRIRAQSVDSVGFFSTP